MDDHGHGSQVAGVITADGVTDPILKGVAPAAGIIAGKVVDSEGYAYYSDIIAATYWAVDDFNVDAVSISLNIGITTYDGFCDLKERYFTSAINYAKSKGVLVVAAAGNGNAGNGVVVPACISSAIAVGAVDSNDIIAYFSSTGKAVDIVAPGVEIKGGVAAQATQPQW